MWLAVNWQDYDILVVGAGPAGASAAAAAARERLRVLMIDRRKVVGVPVQCAEYIPAPLVGELNLGRNYIVQPVRGMKTYIGGREEKTTAAPGFIIRRDRFDRMLVQQACDSGAEIMLTTKAVGRNGNEIVVRTAGEPVATIRAKIVVGADGPLSTVAGWVDAANRNLIRALQVRVALKRPLEFTEVYLEPEFYGGYAWLFPKADQANLGLGIKKQNDRPPPLGPLLKAFAARCAAAGKVDAAPRAIVGGWIPAAPAPKMVCGNVLLAGDAAGHTHPITGAGIFPAVAAGRMAGTWAARALAADDLGLLSGYETEYRQLFGDWMERAVRRRRLMETRWNEFDKIIKTCWVAFREYHGPI